MFPRFIQILAAILLLASAQAGEIKSFYSTTASKFSALVESSEFEKEPEIDYFRAICPGYGGYELIHEGGDARSWVNVSYRGQKSDLYADTMNAARGAFPCKANDVVEWRGVVEDGHFTPFAIIYRMSAANEEGVTDRTTLLVIALLEGKSQLIGSAHGENEDSKAKAIADGWWKARK